MSQSKSDGTEMRKVLIKGVPYFISCGKNILTAQSNSSSQLTPKLLKISKNSVMIKNSIKLLSMYKEQTIYETENDNDEHLCGEYRNLVLKHKQHILTNNGCMVATYTTPRCTTLEKTSTRVTNIIGQKNFDAVFIALCSVISEELKVRAMLALLTDEKRTADASCQTDDYTITSSNQCTVSSDVDVSIYAETGTQTDEMNLDLFNKKKRRIRQKLTPQVIKEEPREDPPEEVKPNKIIIDPYSKVDCMKLETDETGNDNEYEKKGLPLLHIDEDSNCSVLSTFTINSDILNSAPVRSLMEHVDNNIQKEKEPGLQPQILNILDSLGVPRSARPEDQFHLVTPEILKHLTPENRVRLVKYQAYLDWKLCLETNEDGYLPLHLAVLNDDAELVRRQGLVLIKRHATVDLPTRRGSSALRLSLERGTCPAVTATLLQLGADPLRLSAHSRSGSETALHVAAQLTASEEHLVLVLSALGRRARELVSSYPELQYEGLLDKSDEEIARHLMLETSVMCDSRGYTPLMLSARLGLPRHVTSLVRHAPRTLDTGMPSSGNTALYLAVAAAAITATESGNKSEIPENFMKTIAILLEHGADTEVENHSGSKVSDLLQEFGINPLSMLVANTLASRNLHAPVHKPDTFILIKDSKGNVQLTNKNSIPRKKRTPLSKDTAHAKSADSQTSAKSEDSDAKPVIIGNVAISTDAQIQKMSKLAPAATSTQVSNTIVDNPMNIILVQPRASVPNTQTVSSNIQTIIPNTQSNLPNTQNILPNSHIISPNTRALPTILLEPLTKSRNTHRILPKTRAILPKTAECSIPQPISQMSPMSESGESTADTKIIAKRKVTENPQDGSKKCKTED